MWEVRRTFISYVTLLLPCHVIHGCTGQGVIKLILVSVEGANILVRCNTPKRLGYYYQLNDSPSNVLKIKLLKVKVKASHTQLHLGFLAKLRIWQVPACKMEPRSGNIFCKNRPDRPTDRPASLV